jgi:hypothetical protein
MNCVADLIWLRRSSIGSFVERDFFIRIVFQVYFGIDNLETLKKSISMKNSQFFDYLFYAKPK